MTNNDSVVEQIVRSLSFEVIAVPNEKVIQSCSSKSTPFNVKIKVKKKDGDLQQGVLATSKLGPDGVPQRITLVSSDHTIMSFNVEMEDADFVKPVSSRKLVIPNLPIHPGTHDGPYNTTTNQTYKADIKESRTSQSDGALKSTFTLSKVEDDKRLNTSPRAQKKDIFGKCKPGGCLDPPFGEDKYAYEPASNSLLNQERVNTTRPRTSSIFSNKFFNKKKKTKSDKSSVGRSGPTSDEQDSVLGLYRGDSLQTSATLSNTIITYPSIVDESDIKQKLAERKYETISKKSVDLNGGSLYIIPRKNKISTELRDSPNLDQNNNKPEHNFTQEVIPQENDTYVKPVQQMPATESDKNKELDSSDFIKADRNTESMVQNNKADTLLTGIVAPDSTKDFEPHQVSGTSQLNEETSHEKHFAETSQDIKGLVTTGIISAGVVSMAVADKVKSQKATAELYKTAEEKTLSDVFIETERNHIFTIPSDGNDKDSHSETLIKLKTDKLPLSKSVDDNIENLSFIPKTVTKISEISSADEITNNKGIEQYKEDSAEVSYTSKGNALGGDTEKDNNMDNESEINNISSDILLREYSIPAENALGGDTEKDNNMDNESEINKISSDILLREYSIPAENDKIKTLEESKYDYMQNQDQGTRSLEESKYDDMQNQDQGTRSIDSIDIQSQTGTVSALDQPVASNLVSKDIKRNKLNSIATVDIDLRRDWKDGKETIDFNISIAETSSDIMQDELSPRIIRTENDEVIPIKRTGLGEEFKYDDLNNQDATTWVTDGIDNQNQSRTDSQSDQQIKSNLVSEDLGPNEINRPSTIDSSTDKKSLATLNATSLDLANSKIMLVKGRNLGEEVRYGDTNNLKQTSSEDSGQYKLNSVSTVDLDFQRDRKVSKESIDLNLTIDNHNLTPNTEKYYDEGSTNGSVQTQSQELLNKNMRDANLDKDKNIYRDEDTIQTKNENNDLNLQTTTGSLKDRIKTDSGSLASKRKEKFEVNDDFLIDKISKQNESIFSDTKMEENFDQTTLARNYDYLLKEKLKLKDVKESDSKMDNLDKYGTRDKESDIYNKKARDSDNVSKRSKSSVSFDDIVLKQTDIKKIKSTPEITKPIKIDLGFHSYTTDNNEIIIKSFDSKTVLNRHPKDAIIMTSCNVRDPFEMRVPIDNKNVLLIQVKNNSKDDSDVKPSSVLSKYSDRKANSTKSAIRTIQEDKHADVSKLSEVYEKVYENEFGQFHEMIKKLKQEVDVLIHQQNEFKENLRSKRMKQFKLLQGNKRCSCSRKF